MLTLINKVLGLFSKDMGIDLGTCNPLVAVRGQGVVLSEPSVVAVRKGTTQILAGGQAVGYAAKEMLGKCPGNIQAIRPLKNGVISDFDITEAMIAYFITKVHERKHGVRPRIAIAIPSGITGVEKRAVTNSAERAGAREVFLIEEPLAAGIGAGLPIQDAMGSMIVDIGGGTTEVAVLSLGSIVTSNSLRCAGDALDEAIIKHIKSKYNLLIGEQSAEKVKIQIGSVFPLEKELTMDVKGRDIGGNMPRKVTVTSEEIRGALLGPVNQIIASVKTVLENTPPELAADLCDKGLTIAGGGALLRGIDKAFAKEVDIPIRIADDPLTCVARGTGVVLENLDRLKESLESSGDMS